MIITSVNDIFARINEHNKNDNLKLKIITQDMAEIYTQRADLMQQSSDLRVDVDGYLNFSDAIITDIA
jgi:hypothetical protein